VGAATAADAPPAAASPSPRASFRAPAPPVATPSSPSAARRLVPDTAGAPAPPAATPLSSTSMACLLAVLAGEVLVLLLSLSLQPAVCCCTQASRCTAGRR